MSEASSAVRVRKLDNGLTLVTERRGIGPVVFSGVIYRVGSRDERPGLTGISHILEHMMFKGTRKYAKGEIARVVERNGGDLNAFTAEDVTMYYEVFARDRWTLALDIEAERMANLQIDPAELESERQVILEERAMYLDMPWVEFSEELMAAAFRESPYRWPIIGWENDIRDASADDLMQHYRKWYSPGNAAVVVVGDVDPDEAAAEAEARFGSIAAVDLGERRVPREPEPRSCTRVELTRDVGLGHLQVMLRAPEVGTRDSEALLVLAHVLSGMRTSRLDMALLETRKAGDVHVSYHPKADPSGLSVMVEGQPGVEPSELEDLVWAELDRLVVDGVNADEMERTYTQIEAYRLFSNQSPSNRGFILGWHGAHGDATYADRLVDRMRSLTPDDLRAAAARTFVRERCAVGHLHPSQDRKGGPGAPAGNGGGNGRAVAAAARAPSLHGVFCPRRAAWSGIAVTSEVRRLELENGMKVLLQPDRTDAGTSVALLHHGGSVLDTPGLEGRSNLAADTLERGTAKLGFLEFTRRFEELGSNFSLSAGAELIHGGASFLARHLTTGLGLIADVLADPGYREEDLETVRSLALNDLEARRDDLDDVASDLFFRGVADGHPYAFLPQGTEEGIRAVDRTALAAFHAEGFRPDEAHLAIVGDFDEDAVGKILHDRFGRLARPEGAREPRAALPTERRERTLVETRPEKAQVKILYGGPGWTTADPDRLAGVAMNHILGGSSIRSRLGDEIRDKAGLAYSVYSRNWERSAGGFFSVHMGTRPENVRRSVDAIRTELARIAEGVSESELSDAKDFLTGSFPLRFTTYGQIARFRARASFYGWPDDYLQTFVDRARALTIEDLKRIAERVVGAAGVLAVAGPVGEDLETVTA